jgi:hypothetical protein
MNNALKKIWKERVVKFLYVVSRNFPRKAMENRMITQVRIASLLSVIQTPRSAVYKGGNLKVQPLCVKINPLPLKS